MDRRNETVDINANQNPFHIDVKEIIQYKDLIRQFVKRDLLLVYKQTVLGPLWLFLNPLISSVAYSVVFGTLVGVSTDSVPKILFYLSGTSIWWLLQKTFSVSSETFIANRDVFSKVYFPRLIAPIAQTITAIVNFCVQFLMLAAFYLFYLVQGSVTISPWVLLVPALVVQCALLGTGAGLLISSWTAKYRDLTIAATFGLQLWMYISPVIYPLSSTHLTPRIGLVLRLNPMTAILENFRFALLGSGAFLGWEWALSWALTLAVFFCGVLMFNKTQSTFADTI